MWFASGLAANHTSCSQQNGTSRCYPIETQYLERNGVPVFSARFASLLPGWKRLAIMLLAVPAILVGLIAMHVLTTGTSHTPDSHGSTVQVSMGVAELAPTSDLTDHAHPPADCGGTCGSEHDMLGMACILALLMTALLLIVHLTLVKCGSLRSAASTIKACVAALAPPRPPSLFVLSISRT